MLFSRAASDSIRNCCFLPCMIMNLERYKQHLIHILYLLMCQALNNIIPKIKFGRYISGTETLKQHN